MKIGPITLLEWPRTNKGARSESILVAALHWPWSLTWRWIVTRSPRQPLPTKQGFGFMRTHGYRNGINFIATLNAPILGHWCIQAQPNMLDRAAARTEASK